MQPHKALFLGILYFQVGEIHKAEWHLIKALEIDPYNMKTIQNYKNLKHYKKSLITS